MTAIDTIRDLTAPALASAGLELWDVEVSRDIVRIMVDRPGGVDLEALSAASAVVSPLLDEHPDLTPAGRFQLEVSSPGLERTLRTVEQWNRYLGTEVTVKTSVPLDGSRRHRGCLVAVGDEAVRLQTADALSGAIEIRYDKIQRARTVLAWGPTTAEGAKRGPGGAKKGTAGAKKGSAATRRQAPPAPSGSIPASSSRAATDLKDAGS